MNPNNHSSSIGLVLFLLVLLFLQPLAAGSDDPAGEESGEPLCSFRFMDADLVHVLCFFAQRFKLNMAIDPDISGTVTLRLQRVTWRQALELICKRHGLGIEWVGKPSDEHPVGLVIQKIENQQI